jgi:hypothetical protein
MLENKERLHGYNSSYCRLLVVTPCSLGSADKCFGGIFCTSTKEARDNAFLRNVKIHEQPRHPQSLEVEDHEFTAQKKKNETQN